MGFIETRVFDKHELRDNGVGDYDFFCGEERVGFLPFFMGLLITATNVCPKCGKEIGEKHAA